MQYGPTAYRDLVTAPSANPIAEVWNKAACRTPSLWEMIRAEGDAPEVSMFRTYEPGDRVNARLVVRALRCRATSGLRPPGPCVGWGCTRSKE